MSKQTTALVVAMLLLCAVFAGHVQMTLASLANAGPAHSRALKIEKPEPKSGLKPPTREQPAPEQPATEKPATERPAPKRENTSASSSVPVTVTVVSGGGPILPYGFFLDQNHPNPFNATTNIKYGIHKECRVTIEVFNTLGQRVAILVDRVHAPGIYETTWEPHKVGSGLYMCRMVADSYRMTRQMIQLK